MRCFCLIRYDLTSLSHKQYKIDAKNQSYVFGICNTAQTPCAEKSGACEITTSGGDQQKMPLGTFNDDLRFNETGSPYLVYRGGAICRNISQQWITRIEFICEIDSSKHGPNVIENTDCELIIHFLTDLVCQKQVILNFLII